MVKQRFLTHFKPWLFAVIKVVGLIVGYQLFDKARTYFQYAPLNSVDVVLGGDSCSSRDRPALRAVGMGRVVLVQTAQASAVL